MYRFFTWQEITLAYDNRGCVAAVPTIFNAAVALPAPSAYCLAAGIPSIYTVSSKRGLLYTARVRYIATLLIKPTATVCLRMYVVYRVYYV